tara:strand:+ start:216 stop:395 length:180 start_codon:yes stop_codon:yes gene_type:complete
MIDVVKIEFKSASALILLRGEHTNLLEDSKKYGFDLKDIKRCRSTQMDIKDFPNKEWDC